MSTALICVLAALVHAVLAHGARSDFAHNLARIMAVAFIAMAFLSLLVNR
jgi:hypothetical protein